jgi:hypothetical protein
MSAFYIDHLSAMSGPPPKIFLYRHITVLRHFDHLFNIGAGFIKTGKSLLFLYGAYSTYLDVTMKLKLFPGWELFLLNHNASIC